MDAYQIGSHILSNDVCKIFKNDLLDDRGDKSKNEFGVTHKITVLIWFITVRITLPVWTVVGCRSTGQVRCKVERALAPKTEIATQLSDWSVI